MSNSVYISFYYQIIFVTDGLDKEDIKYFPPKSQCLKPGFIDTVFKTSFTIIPL